MQTHGGANAEEAILSSERGFYVDVKVDWGRDGTYGHALSDLSDYVESVVVDRSLAGSAPQEIMLIEGSSAAEMTLVLGGETSTGMPLTAVFSPFNGNSLLYSSDPIGCEIKYRIGVQTALGVVWYNQFVGIIRTITPNRGANQVEITSLDRTELLRKPIPMTDWGILEGVAAVGLITPQLMDARWVIDHCIRHCDVSPSPFRIPSSRDINPDEFYGENDGILLFWASGNGGIAPNIGWVDGGPSANSFPAVTPMYNPYGQKHPNAPADAVAPDQFRAMQAGGGDFNIFWASERRQAGDDPDQPYLPMAGVRFLGFTLHTQSLDGSQYYQTIPDSMVLSFTDYDDRDMEIWIGAGQVWLRYHNAENGSTYTTARVNIPAGQTHVRVMAAYSYNSSPHRMRIYAGANSSAWTNADTSDDFNDDKPSKGQIQVYRKVSLSDIYVAASIGSDNDLGVCSKPAKYAAALDRSKNKLSFLPDVRGNQAWDIITDLVAAEFGAVFWDEDGVFRFWNADTINNKKNTLSRMLSLDEVSGLQITNSLDSVRNEFSVTAKKKRVQSGVVWNAQDVNEFYVPATSWGTFQLWVDGVVTPNSNRPPRYTTAPGDTLVPDWTDDIQFGGVIQQFSGGNWSEVINGPTPILSYSYRGADGSTIFDVWNGYANPIRFATDGDQAALRWNGSRFSDYADQIFKLKDTDSVFKYGSRGLNLSGDWYQEFFDVNGMLSALLEKTAKPIPSTDAITIAGDPRLQLADVMSIQDPNGFGESMMVQILGIRRTFSRTEGLRDDLTVEMIRHANIGYWDSSQYGRWDETFTWS